MNGRHGSGRVRANHEMNDVGIYEQVVAPDPVHFQLGILQLHQHFVVKRQPRYLRMEVR